MRWFGHPLVVGLLAVVALGVALDSPRSTLPNKSADLRTSVALGVFVMAIAAFVVGRTWLWPDWLQHQHRRRQRRGRCPKCGYDLAGLADAAAPCPECGATR